MNISSIQSLNNSLQMDKKIQPVSDGTSFQSMLNQYITEADNAVQYFESKSLALAKGEAINLHDVTIAAQKASIAVTLTTTVRDRAVEAYQEIMRMQV
jgi:flagellar hook-basal body complex protein FliE